MPELRVALSEVDVESAVSEYVMRKARELRLGRGLQVRHVDCMSRNSGRATATVYMMCTQDTREINNAD